MKSQMLIGLICPKKVLITPRYYQSVFAFVLEAVSGHSLFQPFPHNDRTLSDSPRRVDLKVERGKSRVIGFCFWKTTNTKKKARES